MSAPRDILHCDLDAFYASVEQRDHPEWRGKPLIVGGGPNDRGVVSAASYEARNFGVHSAMPLRVAGRLCPHAVFVPGDHERYSAVSEQVMALFAEYTPLVRPISLDEAFLDVSATAHLFGSAEAVGRTLKERVRREVGLVLSVGVAGNKLCAKIASDLGKPDGFVVVPRGAEAAFLAPLPLGRLWGVGEKMREALGALGMKRIGDLASARRTGLETRLGTTGVWLWERANGIDEDPVEPDMRAKSVGGEHTFDQDETDDGRVEATLLRLADTVASRMREAGFRGRCVTLKLRLAPFVTLTRQRTLAQAVDDTAAVYRSALGLLRRERAADRRPVRLVGVSVSALEDRQEGRQLGLFTDERVSRLSAALDAVRAKHGDDAIEQASTRGAIERRRFSDRVRL